MDNIDDEVIGLEALYESAQKCRRGVSWKPSVKQFALNGLEKCIEMSNELQDGTWKHGKPKHIVVTSPKKRDALSVPFRDRVYQRSLNDNVLYPMIIRSFILDNAACQKGKGTDFARKRIKKHIGEFYREYGLDGYVLQVDIHGYYPNMRHDVVFKTFEERLPTEAFERAKSVLNNQSARDVGFNPGSQMVQIAGISVLDKLDHHIKEQLHVRHYIRYMDDFWILVHEKERADAILTDIRIHLENIGFAINESKTHIKPIKHPFDFLGFRYKITESGKIIMFVNSNSVRREKRKLKRLVMRVQKGLTTKEKVYECYNAWKETISHGNSYNVRKRMDAYLESLWKE